MSNTFRRVVGGAPFVAALLTIALPAAAQTIRPLLNEYTSRARGRVELTNDSAWPLDVVM